MELLFNPAMELLGFYPKNSETPIQKNLCTPMFIAAQFTIAKCWDKVPISNQCPSLSVHSLMDQKSMVHLHSGILCSTKKDGAPTLHNSLNGSGDHYGKLNKPGSKGQIPYDLTFNWNIINKRKKASKI